MQYRMKARPCDAVQLTESAAMPFWLPSPTGSIDLDRQEPPDLAINQIVSVYRGANFYGYALGTLNGAKIARMGDWIVLDDEQLQVVKAFDFERNWEPAL